MSDSRPMRILIIDDNPDDRQLEMREVRAVFPDAELLELADLSAFEAALDAGAPDLVVTDLDLKWADGGEVLMMVKSRYAGCPVVMFTGTGDETVAVELMKAGLDDYVVKSPRQLPRLRTSLKIAVDLASSRAALTDREKHLAQALAEQKTLVRELHHRVKNNLQTMTSLVNMRARTVDEASRFHLEEIAGRMAALGAVQARIYDTAQFDRVDFAAALEDIATTLASVHSDGGVRVQTHFAAPLELDVARAMPLSLLCHELILNAFKHAWPDKMDGMLTIGIVPQGQTLMVRIEDDGVGFVEDMISKGLGNRLVRALAREAGVTLDLVSSPGRGTQITMRFE